MKNIYLDNGSTSFPKAPGVGVIMKDYIENIGVNVARGSYESAYEVAELMLDTRERLCALLHGDKAENVVFTSGATQSLNILLKGFLRPGDHVLCSSLEHNAVMRPLTQLCSQGVSFDRIPCSSHGEMDLDALKGLLRPETRLLVATHASNICGILNPIDELGKFCRRHGLRFVVDCAQTAGCLPIDMVTISADAIVFSGHKGLLGPQGIGGFMINAGFASELRPLITGGTGSASDSEEQPEFMPDKFEAGTQNIPGILGIREGLIFIEKTGLNNIHAHEAALALKLTEGIRGIHGIRVLGTGRWQNRAAVVSVDFLNRDNAEVAWELNSKFGILTRCGLHCAPSAHRALGTFPRGSVRFSPGWSTTEEEIDFAIAAIASCAGSF